jgi:hypothetical protein
MAAEKLGLTVAAVMRRRGELGLPDVDEQFQAQPKRHARKATTRA